MAEKWLAVEDVADELGIGKMTVYRLLSRGAIPAYRFGRAYRVKPEDLAAYIRTCQVTAPENGRAPY